MTNYKEIAMIIGIAVLFALLVGLAIDAFYVEPQYEKFCNSSYYRYGPYTKPLPPDYIQPQNCSYEYGEEYNKCINDRGNPIFDIDEKGCQFYSTCDYCSRDFDIARNKYNRNVFYIIAPIAILAIIFGVLIRLDFVGTGFMFGGILSLIYGTARYFTGLSKVGRVIIVFIELLILIWIGYKKVRKRK